MKFFAASPLSFHVLASAQEGCAEGACACFRSRTLATSRGGDKKRRVGGGDGPSRCQRVSTESLDDFCFRQFHEKRTRLDPDDETVRERYHPGRATFAREGVEPVGPARWPWPEDMRHFEPGT